MTGVAEASRDQVERTPRKRDCGLPSQKRVRPSMIPTSPRTPADERCMAIPVLVAVDPVADELVPKTADRMGTLRTGDGRRGADMGPLVTGQRRDKVASYIDLAVADGATIVADGRKVEADGDPRGSWLGPTLIDNVPVTSRVYTEEIFGPVLAVARVPSDTGLRLINSGAFGNGTAIFTSDGRAARRFQKKSPSRHDRHQRADPGARRHLQLRGLEGLPVRRRQSARRRGRTVTTPSSKPLRAAGPTPRMAASTWASPGTEHPGRRCSRPGA